MFFETLTGGKVRWDMDRVVRWCNISGFLKSFVRVVVIIRSEINLFTEYHSYMEGKLGETKGKSTLMEGEV